MTGLPCEVASLLSLETPKQRLEVFPCDFCRWVSYRDIIHLEAPRPFFPKISSRFTPQAFSSFSIRHCVSRMVLYPVSIAEGGVGGQSVLNRQHVCWGNGAVPSESSLIKPVRHGCRKLRTRSYGACVPEATAQAYQKLQRMRTRCLKVTALGSMFYCTLRFSVHRVAACATHTQRISIPLPPGLLETGVPRLLSCKVTHQWKCGDSVALLFLTLARRPIVCRKQQEAILRG